MAKKTSHKTPRVAVQIQKPWADLARKLAAKNKQPTTWYLISLLAAAAEAQDVEIPALPWDEDVYDG